MIPIADKGTNALFGLDGYEKLPGQLYEESCNGSKNVCVQSVWQLTDDEIKTLIDSKKIYVSTVGEHPQPIDVSVTSFTEE